MTRFSIIVCFAALSSVTMTGCFNRAQNPYGYYNNGVIPPPATGAYGNYNGQTPAPYYQAYQTPPPVGYGQPNVTPQYQNWQTNPNVNVASTAPYLQPQQQVAPASYNVPYPNDSGQNPETVPQNSQQPQFQPPADVNFDDAGFSDQQGSLNQMHINQPGSQKQSSQAVFVPVNGANTNPNYVAAGSVQQVQYVPIDSGAIVLPQDPSGYQPNAVPVYQPGAYQPTTSPGTTGGTTVARNSTLASHNPQWQGYR